jgi:phosphate transport system protein
MRKRYSQQLEILHSEMVEMGELCEASIKYAMQGLLTGDLEQADRAKQLSHELDEKERTIETLCLKMILQQQPVAGDLRQISAALKMITDMERIGDQAEDIAEISKLHDISKWAKTIPVEEMSKVVMKMVTQSVDAYVNNDISLAKEVIINDDMADNYFNEIKECLIERIGSDRGSGEYAIDLLMISKYLERIGDHATNIAEWVEYSVTGIHKGNPDQLGLL